MFLTLLPKNPVQIDMNTSWSHQELDKCKKKKEKKGEREPREMKCTQC